VTHLDTAQAPVITARQTSTFVTGIFPRRRVLLLVLSLVAGLVIAYLWSANLVDDEIGFNSADKVLGHDAKDTPISSIASGVVFAFVSGMAGSFTACNIAAFGAVGPLVGQQDSRRIRLAQTLRPLGWLAIGMTVVSAVYGAIVGLVGTRMPQFSMASGGSGISPRIAQAMVAFGIVGVAMLVLGLASAGIVKDPLGPVSRRFPNAPLLVMGALIGGFLIGRPYPLFHNLFHHAAQTHNPFYGALAFALQSLGNIVVMGLLFLLLSYGTGGRVPRWLGAKPGRIATVTASAFLVAGAFTLAYWELRILGRFGYLWFPTAPWNN
jgi:MFS family permease